LRLTQWLVEQPSMEQRGDGKQGRDRDNTLDLGLARACVERVG
jgi:hypothetical protein